MLTIDDVLEILSTPLLGIIPGERGSAARVQCRLAGDAEQRALSAPARAYFDAARRLQGEDVPMIVPEREQRHLQQAVRTESSMSLFNFFRRGIARPLRASACKSCSRTSAWRAISPTCSASCARKSSP